MPLQSRALSTVFPVIDSVVRQIPDNQEVFVHPGTDQSIIIELMEAVDSQQPDEHAIR